MHAMLQVSACCVSTRARVGSCESFAACSAGSAVNLTPGRAPAHGRRAQHVSQALTSVSWPEPLAASGKEPVLQRCMASPPGLAVPRHPNSQLQEAATSSVAAARAGSGPPARRRRRGNKRQRQQRAHPSARDLAQPHGACSLLRPCRLVVAAHAARRQLSECHSLAGLTKALQATLKHIT